MLRPQRLQTGMDPSALCSRCVTEWIQAHTREKERRCKRTEQATEAKQCSEAPTAEAQNTGARPQRSTTDLGTGRLPRRMALGDLYMSSNESMQRDMSDLS